MRKDLIFTILAASYILIQSNQAIAEINIFEGIEMATLEINGENITFPIGDTTRKNDIYYLKKALKGDQDAMDMFLGGSNERWFFVGIETPLWLRVDKSGAKVIKP